MKRIFNWMIFVVVLIVFGSLTASDKYEAAAQVDALKDECFSLLTEKRDYPAALKECQKGLKLADEKLPKDHASRASVLYTIGQVYQYMGDYLKALTYLEDALKIMKKTLPADHPSIASSLYTIGTVYMQMGDYPEAFSYLVAARNIFRRTFSPDHPSIASSLFTIGQLYWQMGDYPKALTYLENALKIRKKNLSADPSDIAMSLYTIGLVYRDMGDYPKALTYLEDALKIRKKTLPADHPSIASSLYTIGKIYQDMDDYSKALTYQEESLKIRKKTLPPDHPSIASSLFTIRELYWQMGDYPKALTYQKEALKIWEKTMPADAGSFFTLGQIYRDIGDYPKALSLLKVVLKIDKETFSPDHPNIAGSLYNIGQLYMQMGDYPKALTYLEDALKIDKKTLVPDHPDIAGSFYMLSMVNSDMGKTAESRTYSKQGVILMEKHINHTFSVLNEQQRINIVRKKRFYFDRYLTFFDTPSDPPDNYSHLLRWKSSALVALLSEREAVYSGNNPELKKLFDEKNSLVRKYNDLLNTTPENTEAAEKLKKDIAAIQNDIAGLEQKISSLSTDYRKTHKLTTAGVKDICKALPVNAVMVDFLRYHRYNPALLREKNKEVKMSESRYIAFVINGGENCEKTISRIEIKDADQIDNNANLFNEYISKGDVNAMKKPQEFLSNRLWSPIAEKIKGKKRVYIVPDGALAKVPFDVLLDNKGEMLIDTLTIGYLDLPHGIIRMADKDIKHNSGFLAVGGVNFDNMITEPQEEKLIAEKRSSVSTGITVAMADKQAVTRGGDDLNWKFLDGSKEEVYAVAPMMKNQEKTGIVLSDKDATKKVVSGLMPGRRYLYFTTHGKFEGVKTLEIKEEMRGLSDTGPKATAEHDPMRASYLVFAGANKEKERAYLTAAEIMVLDLRGTELTVLSACQTGLGNENSGEGIMGLRRAFLGAGSEGLVLTLWESEDNASMKLMQTFMEERMKNPDTVEAMRKAKQKLMEDKDYSNPIFWAPFVVTGR